MKYVQPFGVTDPNAGYQNGNPELGIEGSIVPAAALEAPQREMQNVIVASGQTPDPNDTTQLLKVFGLLTPRIATNPVLYVRTDGNDANDGSTNDGAHAFATIAGAIMKGIKSFSLAGASLTIQLGIPGTYAAPGELPVVPGTMIVRGNPLAPSDYIIAGPGVGSGTGVTVVSGGTVRFSGVYLRNTGANNWTLAAIKNGSIDLGDTMFDVTVAGSSKAHLLASGGGSITINAGCSFAGSMTNLWYVLAGRIVVNGVAVTLTGTPAYAGATIQVGDTGSVQFGSGSSFVGGATGGRYYVQTNGVIQTLGGGANFIPGNSAGAVATGGQYA